MAAPGPLLESYSRPDSGFHRFEVPAMGTHNVLLLAGEEEKRLREAAQDAFGILERLEQSLSKFLPTSDVSLLNALGASRPVRVGRDLLRLLELSREAWEITGGAFDPTIGPLMAAWGLVAMEGRIPPEDEIRKLLDARGMDHIIIDPGEGTAGFDRPGLSIDLGAIGKGYAVDAVRRRLEEAGVEAGVIISGRSSILAWGLPPGEDHWRLEVMHPDEPGEVLGVLEAEPGAVSSSGASERRFFRHGKEYGHVLDPRTGRPARALKGVTAWTETALLGDVLTTALFVLGRGALAPGGPAARLIEAWTPPGLHPRAAVLLVEEDTAAWGGLRLETFPIGAPAFTLSSR